MFFHGIWFVGDGETSDWFCQVFRDADKWVCEYRFRYYAEDDPGNDPWSGKDRKNWYRFEATDCSDVTRTRMVDFLTTKLLPLMEVKFGTKADFVDLDCDNSDPKFFFELGSRYWCNLKIIRDPAGGPIAAAGVDHA